MSGWCIPSAFSWCGTPPWLYSFFDSFNLRNLADQEMAPADEWLFGLSEMDSEKLASLCCRRHSIVGWVLVLLGVYILFDTVVGRLMQIACEYMGDWWLLCFILLCAALCLYAIAWWLMYGPEYGFCI